MIKLRELKVKVIIMKKYNLSNPKLSKDTKYYKFRYYAGYSSKFVEDVILNLEVSHNSIILDPWNGSGTTTLISSNLGASSIGLDINPVMTIIAKSRMQVKEETLIPEFNKVISSFTRTKKIEISEKDLLLNWFTKESVELIRMLEKSIQKNIMKLKKTKFLVELDNFDQINENVAFSYVILFEVVKSYLKDFKVSNPTWIKKAKLEEEKISIDKTSLRKKFNETFKDFYKDLNIENKNLRNLPTIKVASSYNTTLKDLSIDYVITSPPYCTRIDYVIATSIELAILGYDSKSFEELRLEMIGTTKILKNIDIQIEPWGEYSKNFLREVYNHTSVSSKTYYYKQFLQYFYGMYKSFVEIDRVLKSNGQAIIVVQDSYYKDLYLDLSKVFSEMTSTLSWGLVAHEKYQAKSLMSRINSKSRNYQKDTELVEHILIFKKGELTDG